MKKDKIFEEALNLRDEFIKDPDEYLAYLKREMEIMDYDNALYEAGLDGEARGFAKGEATGFAKGEARGFAKGEARGEAKAIYKKINSLVSQKKLSLEAALELLDVSEQEWSEIKQVVEENQK